MPIVYIGIGSNIGSREENCLRAIGFLKSTRLSITKQSSMYETAPWGMKEQPSFINMAIEIQTDLSPQELLILLKKIECDMGREQTTKWGPRIIDLDILLYGDRMINENGLKIPHPLMNERNFVLIPLSEIAPGLIHPILLKKISELLQDNKKKN
jgi:2-amino-4-hydroxy-6-hydroxymethyldihydropteridine diphosphokinase